MPDNAVGPASLLDCSRPLHQVLVIDEEAGTVDVEPGIVGTLGPARWHATGDCRTPSPTRDQQPPTSVQRSACRARHPRPRGGGLPLGPRGLPRGIDKSSRSRARRSRRYDALVAAKVDRSPHVRARPGHLRCKLPRWCAVREASAMSSVRMCTIIATNADAAKHARRSSSSHLACSINFPDSTSHAEERSAGGRAARRGGCGFTS
jgi:hypothetical protein